MDKELAKEERNAITYRYDRLRAIFFGLLEPGWVTFSLLIAIRVFEAPDWAKAAIPAAGPIGLLLTSVSLLYVSKLQKPTAQAIAFYLIVSGALLLVTAIAPTLYLFVGIFIVAHVIYAQQAPLITQIYTENYLSSERGKKISTLFVIIGIGGTLSSFLGGKLLDWNTHYYPALLVCMALATWANAALVMRIPTKPLSYAETGNMWNNVSLLWKDRLFAWLLMCWMLMGIGNLMTIPLRVEYMADPHYGINASNGQIAMLTFGIPAIMRILSAKVWGYLFDRMNFILWRVAINACFAIGFILFFSTSDLLWLSVGSAFSGVAIGGGFLAWNLWITKIAPPEKVPAYMSIHAACTGARGVAAPFLGYWFYAQYGAKTAGLIAAAMMVISSAMFIIVKNSARFDGGKS